MEQARIQRKTRGFDNRPRKRDDGNRFLSRGGNSWLRSASYFCEPAVNDDAQLIHQTLAGHSAAFGQLVLKYQDRLYNTVFHVVGNAEDAKDVVQDAFVQAFLKVDTLQQRRRVLHLALPDCLQRGGQPPSPAPPDRVGRTSPPGGRRRAGRRRQRPDRAAGTRRALPAGPAGDRQT